MTTRRRALAARTAGLVLAVTALVGAPLAVGAASATAGSVPLVVANYAADGLLGRLDDLFGIGAGGNGLDFGTDSKVGEVDRVFTWRSDFLAGRTGSTPVKLTNEWTATITIADKPVGVATIWINPDGDVPDLADFTRGASLGASFAALPADATLVHDTARSAWFTLTGDALDPIVPGDSGVKSTTTPAAYRDALAAAAAKPPVAPAGTNQGATNSIIVVAVAVLAVIALVVLTGRRSQKARDAAAEASPEPAAAPPTPPEPAAASAKRKPPTAKPTVPKQASAKPAPTAKPTTTKPVKSPVWETSPPATSAVVAPSQLALVPASAPAPSKSAGAKPAAKVAKPVAKTTKPAAAGRPAVPTGKPAVNASARASGKKPPPPDAG